MSNNPRPPVIDFSATIAAKTRDYVERAWALATIADWLTSPDAPRHFLLSGEPGSGKSVIAARLCQIAAGQAAAPPEASALGAGLLSALHFCSARDRRWVDPSVFAESLAMQLAARYPAYARALAELSGDRQVRVEVRLAATTVSGSMTGVVIEKLDLSGLSAEDTFNRAVREPLQALCAAQPDERIVILVDALDESLVYSGKVGIVALLAQSDDLPANVRIVLTSRRDARVENEFPGAAGIFLSAPQFDQRNDADIRAYAAARFRASEKLAAEMAALPAGRFDDLTREIATRSAGNFQYASFLMDSIVKGGRALDELDGLPDGLDALYLDSLQRVVKNSAGEWARDYAPLLGVLSVAQQPLNLERLRAFTGLGESALWAALGDVQQFLQEFDAAGGQTTYALYHQSVTDFLHAPAIARAGKSLRNTFYLAAEEWHRQIASVYEAALGSWAAPDAGRADGYGLNGLAAHLYALRAEEPTYRALHALIGSDSWLAARFAGDNFGYGGFVADVALAAQAAVEREEADRQALRPMESWTEIVRTALLTATVASISCQLPPVLLAQAVVSGVWTAGRALGLVSQYRETAQRVDGYRRLLDGGKLDAAQRGIAEAGLAAAQSALDAQPAEPEAGYGELRTAGGRLADDGFGLGLFDESDGQPFEEVLQALPDIADELLIPGSLTGWKRPAQRTRFDDMLRGPGPLYQRDRRLVERLEAELTPELAAAHMRKLVARLRRVQYGDLWDRALAVIARHAPVDELPSVFYAVTLVPDPDVRADIIVSFAPRIGRAAFESLLAALLTVREDESERLALLSVLAPQLSGARRERAIAAAMELFAGRPASEYHQTALSVLALAPSLPDVSRASTIEWAVPNIADEDLGVLLPLLDDDRRQETARRALERRSESEEPALVAPIVVLLSRYISDEELAPHVRFACSILGVAEADALVARWQAVPAGTERERTRTTIMLALALRLHSDPLKVQALRLLAPGLNSEQVQSALEAVERMSDATTKAQGRLALALRLAQPEREVYLARTLEAALTAASADGAASVLGELAREFPEWTSGQAGQIRPALVSYLQKAAEAGRAPKVRRLRQLLPAWRLCAPPEAVDAVGDAVFEVCWDKRWP